MQSERVLEGINCRKAENERNAALVALHAFNSRRLQVRGNSPLELSGIVRISENHPARSSAIDTDDYEWLQKTVREAALSQLHGFQNDLIEMLFAMAPDDARPRLVAAGRTMLEGLRQQSLRFALDGCDPEISDLAAGEYQEAFEKLARGIEDLLDRMS